MRFDGFNWCERRPAPMGRPPRHRGRICAVNALSENRRAAGGLARYFPWRLSLSAFPARLSFGFGLREQGVVFFCCSFAARVKLVEFLIRQLLDSHKLIPCLR